MCVRNTVAQCKLVLMIDWYNCHVLYNEMIYLWLQLQKRVQVNNTVNITQQTQDSVGTDSCHNNAKVPYCKITRKLMSVFLYAYI